MARPVRVARRLRAGAAAHDAPLHRVGLRAVHLRRHRWLLGDAAALGLLDPLRGPGLERAAVRPGELTRLQEILNPAEAVASAEDKRRSAEIFARAGLPTPAQATVLERRADRAMTVRAWADALERTAPQEAVVKPVEGHRGLGVRVLHRGPAGLTDHAGAALSWTDLARELASERWRAFIVQERLHPHAALRELSGRDVLQTLRVVTLRDEAGAVRVLFALLRIAVGSEPVDSFRSGATRNAVAILSGEGVTGATYRVARSGFGLEPTPVHPATGRPTIGFQVPDWDEVRTLVTRAADAFAPLRTVGWDVAPTDAGPVLVEANAWWALLSTPEGATLPVRAALRDAAGSQRRATA
jgi:Sugar-transfer associated ATP-grasp